MLKKLVLSVLFLLTPMVLFGQDNQVKIVALVLTTAEYNPSSDNIVHSLESLDAQILRVESPNASELRSVLKRFAAAAIDVDVALVFVDAPILQMGEREFLIPADINLRRSSDLLTQAIPVSALARATTLAGNGGAIFVHSADFGRDLPDGVVLAQIAPEARPGVSPVLVGQSGSAMALANVFDQHSKRDSMNLNALLDDLTARIEFSVSYRPTRTLILSRADVVRPAYVPPAQNVDANVGPVTPNADTNGHTVIVTDGQGADISATPPASNDATTAIVLPQIQTSPAAEIAETLNVETVDPNETKPLSIELLIALQSGLSRNDKREIQRRLRDFGFYSGLIDGIFGNQTKFSIEAYQGSINADITGVLSVDQLNSFIN